MDGAELLPLGRVDDKLNLFVPHEPWAVENMTMPSATIIIPVWNGENGLQSCLNSIMKQDFESSEVIVIDDGSTDRSLEIVKTTMAEDPHIRILTHPENQGLGKTLNEGIKTANGEFVFIVHQDCEIVDSNFLSKSVAALDQNPEIAAVTGRRLYQINRLCDKEKLFMVANGHLAEVDHEEIATEDLTFTELKCDLFRKKLVENLGGFSNGKFRSSGEDQVLSSRLRTSGYKLVRLGSISYKLGFGKKETTFKGIFEKLRQYGKTQVGVIFSERSSALKGISRSKALSDRAMNRLQMLLSATVITAGLALAVLFPYFIFLPLSMAIIRLLIYGSRLRRIRGRIRLALLGPILDIFYSIGFLEGIIASAAGRQL
jgi:glycosyltransferase involved in cell wall biosynthesis